MDEQTRYVIDEYSATGRLAGVAGEVRLLSVSCFAKDEDGSETLGQWALLAAVQTGPGALRGIGYLLSVVRQDWVAAGFHDAEVVLDLQQQRSFVTLQQRRAYRWTGKDFVQVDGPTDFPSQVTPADVDPAEWLYQIEPPGMTQEDSLPANASVLRAALENDKCWGWIEVQLHHGEGTGSSGASGRPRLDCRLTAALLANARADVEGPGEVIVAVLRFGYRDAVLIQPFAFYDRPHNGEPRLVVQPLVPPGRIVDVDRATIADDGMLEVVGRGPSGEQTARWRWQTRYTLSPWFGLVDG